MEKRILTKSDGRKLILYSLTPIPEGIAVPSPQKDPLPHASHLRFDPMKNEWVIYASHRQNRTFLPPADFNPLAPGDDPAQPTELPYGEYDAAVFENLFPSLALDNQEPAPASVPTLPAHGACEVVVYTQNPQTSLGELPLDHIELLIHIWGDRTRDLGARNDVKYVFIFENRGVEVGATLHHPHGQIYAYPFIPPIAFKELESQNEYFQKNNKGLLATLIENEISENSRVLYQGPGAVAFVPVFARYAYEVWVAPQRAAATFADLNRDEVKDLAKALKTVLLKFDKLWSRPFPYVMVWHQAPTDGKPHPEAHLHAEFYPPYRMPGRLKYLAGSEIGAGVFTSDTLPEEKAQELKNVSVLL